MCKIRALGQVKERDEDSESSQKNKGGVDPEFIRENTVNQDNQSSGQHLDIRRDAERLSLVFCGNLISDKRLESRIDKKEERSEQEKAYQGKCGHMRESQQKKEDCCTAESKKGYPQSAKSPAQESEGIGHHSPDPDPGSEVEPRLAEWDLKPVIEQGRGKEHRCPPTGPSESKPWNVDSDAFQSLHP